VKLDDGFTFLFFGFSYKQFSILIVETDWRISNTSGSIRSGWCCEYLLRINLHRDVDSLDGITGTWHPTVAVTHVDRREGLENWAFIQHDPVSKG